MRMKVCDLDVSLVAGQKDFNSKAERHQNVKLI